MEIVEVPIVDFYQNCKNVAKAKGYSLLLTLIAREGDQPDVYEQCLKYWESLHDVTGKSVLFLFSSQNINDRIDKIKPYSWDFDPYSGLKSVRSSTLFFNNQIAISTRESLPTYGLSEYREKEQRYRPVEPRFIKEQSLQVTSLIEYLGISEKDVPALYIQTLHSDTNYIVQLSKMHEFNIYAFLKELIESLGDTTRKIRSRGEEAITVEGLLCSSNRRLLEIEREKKIWVYEIEKNRITSILTTVISTTSIDSFLELTDKGILDDKAKCWHFFNHEIRPLMTHDDCAIFQSFIDKSMNPRLRSNSNKMSNLKSTEVAIKREVDSAKEKLLELKNTLLKIEGEFDNALANFIRDKIRIGQNSHKHLKTEKLEVETEVKQMLETYFNRISNPIFHSNALSELSEVAYFQILDYIILLGKNLENFRDLNANFDEERYRDYFLPFLNAISNKHAAKGEIFNRKGKTDILVFDDKGNNIFIAECKMWRGAAYLLSAVDQLLRNYVNWRDEKIAIIVFNNKNRAFTELISTATSAVARHELCYKYIGSRTETSFSYLFRNANDADKLIKLELVLMNFT